ncbi:hypothetical protein [Actinoplanes sp. NPDC049265]|uniref:dioxygenase family protein n=1 Tax=Actinoplanes sp. NPDC049265 TaxID=3363902 RepID=UPI00371C6419
MLLLGRIDNRERIQPVAGRTTDPAADHGLGPYYIPGPPHRRDIREDVDGAPLLVRIRVVEAETQAPLAGVGVEIWHCGPNGKYSGFLGYSSEKMPPLLTLKMRRSRPTDAKRFLRGGQVADSEGRVEFQTVVPGWYTPRTPHMHVRVARAGQTVLTTELFLPDDLTAHVQSLPPYAERGRSPFTNINDIGIRLAKGSPCGWPTVRRTDDGHEADFTLQVSR